MRNRIIKSITIVFFIVLFLSSICYADNDTDDQSSGQPQSHYFSDVYNTGEGNGYSGYREIDENDIHYGWILGEFKLSNYVDKKTDANGNMVFFKNYDSMIQLDFILEQDIEALNGNYLMHICDDQNGYDEEFNVSQGGIGYGCLIVSKVDHENNTSVPVLYSNFLTGVKADIETNITFLEEGDYTVVLDYEINNFRVNIPLINPDSEDQYSNYRMKFSFSIRNSNCTFFLRDKDTGSDLPEKAIAPNGFIIELANSHYLKIYVKRSELAADGYSLTEDTSYNTMKSNGEEITEEGLYEITIENPDANLKEERIVYVGSNPILKAYIVTGYSLEEIHKLIEDGAIITVTGEIITPVPTETPTPEPTTDSTLPDQSEQSSVSHSSDVIIVVAIIATTALLFVAILSILRWRILKSNTTSAEKAPEAEDSPDKADADSSLEKHE